MKWSGKWGVAPSQTQTPPECDNPSCHVHNCRRSLTQPAIIPVRRTVRLLVLLILDLSLSD